MLFGQSKQSISASALELLNVNPAQITSGDTVRAAFDTHRLHDLSIQLNLAWILDGMPAQGQAESPTSQQVKDAAVAALLHKIYLGHHAQGALQPWVGLLGQTVDLLYISKVGQQGGLLWVRKGNTSCDTCPVYLMMHLHDHACARLGHFSRVFVVCQHCTLVGVAR